MSQRGGRGRGGARGEFHGRGHGRGGGFGDRGRGGPPRGGMPSGPKLFSPPSASHSVPPNLQKEGDELVQKLKTLTMTGDGPKPHVRPGYGTQGKAVVLRANHFKMTASPSKPFFEYHISFDPQVGPKRVRKRLLEILESKIPDFQKYRNFIAHDSSGKLISCARLHPQNKPLTFTVRLFDEDEEENEKSKTYKITISFVKELEMDFQKYLNGTNNDFEINPILSALNILLEKHAKSAGGIRVGKDPRYFFEFQNEVRPLGRALEARKGFYTSVRPTVNSLMVNVNVCYTAFYLPGNLADAIEAFLQESFQGNPEKLIQGVKVSPTHLSYKPKKIVKKLLLGNAAFTKTFLCEELGGRVSVANYFRQKYNKIVPPNRGMLVDLGTKQKENLVPAVFCDILPNQAFKGKLLERHTADMIKYAANRPADNARTIVGQGLGAMGLAGTQTLQNFGVKVSQDMAVVPGRILAPPKLAYKNSTPTPSDAQWNLRNVKFYSGVTLDKWGLLVIMSRQNPAFNSPDDAKLKEIVSTFVGVCTETGMPTREPMMKQAVMIDWQNVATGISSIGKAVANLKQRGVRFILVILPDKNKRIYAGVRKACDVDHGVHATCMLTERLAPKPPSPQYMANVALKINPKLGGVNHKLLGESDKLLYDEVTMLVGMDVTHPGPGSLKGSPSIAGVVASYDVNHTLYSASLCLQKSNQEMVDNLAKMMEERLLHFYKVRNKLPQRVIVFRDGVSEGQFVTVLEQEYPKFLEAFRRVSTKAPGKTYKPKLTVVICGKRHNTRFYPVDEESADKNGNPKPGTIVDRGVTAIYEFDFFLQAHQGLQGSAKPTHYTVIYDENNFNADKVQQLIHHASYTFARATKAVSLIPPAYYADLLCERGRCYIQDLLASEAGSAISYGDEMAVYDAAVKAWGKGVHEDVASTMFYI